MNIKIRKIQALDVIWHQLLFKEYDELITSVVIKKDKLYQKDISPKLRSIEEIVPKGIKTKFSIKRKHI